MPKKKPDSISMPPLATLVLRGMQTQCNNFYLPCKTMRNSLLTWPQVAPIHCYFRKFDRFIDSNLFLTIQSFYSACEAGNRQIAKILLDFGADGRCHSVTKYSPLYIASYQGQREVVEMLLIKFPELVQVTNPALFYGFRETLFTCKTFLLFECF